MAINKRFILRVTTALIFFGLTRALPAQTSGYFLNTESGEVRVFQRLAWAGGEYSLRYEVLIERNINGVFQNHLREFTQANFIDVSLPPGNYRFRVIPYDMLDRPDEGSDWEFFLVLQYVFEMPFALEPEIEPEPVPQIVLEPEKEKEAKIKKTKPVTVKISAAWSPLFQIYGYDYKDSFILSAANMRFSVLFSTPMDIHIGPEAAASWHMADSEHALEAGVNLFAKKWLPNERVAIGIRFGAVTSLLQTEQLHIGVTAGGSFHWRIFSGLMLEAGFDYTNTFSDIAGGCVRPWIGLGVQF